MRATVARPGPDVVLTVPDVPPPVRPLVGDALGEQRRAGVRLGQVDGTAAGAAVLVALASRVDPGELAALDAGGPDGFRERWQTRQRAVARAARRWWPLALGTTPPAMARWLRARLPGSGYHVRLVDDLSRLDVLRLVIDVEIAVQGGWPVPLVVGGYLPRHVVLVVSAREGEWRVYEPVSAQVRALDVGRVYARRLAPVLGFDRPHAVVLPGTELDLSEVEFPEVDLPE